MSKYRIVSPLCVRDDCGAFRGDAGHQPHESITHEWSKGG